MNIYKKRGFTLIELLIVVAIIAILAAIAIPNFLAAQVRSKVSRAKAEMRTLATALESYNVDNNNYPEDLDNPWPWYVPNVVTTPISYITNSYLEDPFRTGIEYTWDPDKKRGRRYRYLNYYVEINGHWVNNWTGVFDPVAAALGREKYGEWRLSSAGPDQTAAADWGLSGVTIYDATNGTVSNGDIVRSQKEAEQKN